VVNLVRAEHRSAVNSPREVSIDAVRDFAARIREEIDEEEVMFIRVGMGLLVREETSPGVQSFVDVSRKMGSVLPEPLFASHDHAPRDRDREPEQPSLIGEPLPPLVLIWEEHLPGELFLPPGQPTFALLTKQWMAPKILHPNIRRARGPQVPGR
jgi:hypothetical protein